MQLLLINNLSLSLIDFWMIVNGALIDDYRFVLNLCIFVFWLVSNIFLFFEIVHQGLKVIAFVGEPLSTLVPLLFADVIIG
jgi:hypothetical protein